MHFLSQEIILHGDASYVRFGKTFQPIDQAWHRNEAPKSAFWFGSVHTSYIGTGAISVPGFGTQPYCWGGMEAQVSLTVAFSSSAFFGLLFSSWHRFSMGFRSGEFNGQSSTPTPWPFKLPLVLLAVWAGAKSCWKRKSASLKRWSAEGSIKCSKMYW